MATPFQPHYDNLIGFAFWIVIQILDEIGPPMPVAQMPPRIRKRFEATLATELAAHAVTVLHLGRPVAAVESATESALRSYKYGKYFQLKEREARIIAELDVLRAEERRLCKEVYRISDSQSDTEWDPEVPELARTNIRWRADLVGEERVSAAKTAIAMHLARMKRARKSVQKIRALLRKARPKIERSIKLSKAYKNCLFTFRIANFDAANDYQYNGLLFYLRLHWNGWLNEFTRRFSELAEVEITLYPLRVALRDGMLLFPIGKVAPSKGNSKPNASWDVNAVKSLKESMNNWSEPRTWTAENISAIRRFLRGQDIDILEWYHSRGCDANFCTRWLANLSETSGGRNVWGPRTFDEEWIQTMQAKYVTGSLAENVERDQNELSWCLAEGREDIYPFVPTLSLRQDAKVWAQQLASLKEEIAAERLAYSEQR